MKIRIKYIPWGNYYQFLCNGEVIAQCDNNDADYRETREELRSDGYEI